jgi:hypothetical protein
MYTVQTQDCVIDRCVPIGLETINATGRGSFVVATNYESPFLGKFCQIQCYSRTSTQEITHSSVGILGVFMEVLFMN